MYSDSVNFRKVSTMIKISLINYYHSNAAIKQYKWSLLQNTIFLHYDSIKCWRIVAAIKKTKFFITTQLSILFKWQSKVAVPVSPSLPHFNVILCWYIYWILTKLGTYLDLKRIWNRIDFQGQRSRSQGLIFRRGDMPRFALPLFLACIFFSGNE
jgi:hypothetical protein